MAEAVVIVAAKLIESFRQIEGKVGHAHGLVETVGCMHRVAEPLGCIGASERVDKIASRFVYAQLFCNLSYFACARIECMDNQCTSL